ncbi:MAG: zinc ribbon domain-containing protein [Pirellulales bacterium]|nr:zinc ribbon domain-containing protein [Pirellulales bacterium]
MPLYEYECKSCQTVVESLVRTESDHREQQTGTCPDCGQKGMQRVFSVPASPAVKSGSSLPVTSEGCGAPRCCGGGCQI